MTSSENIGSAGTGPVQVCERRGPDGAGFSERHLQCVWFDPQLRPAGLLTERGEPVEVEDPGVWNAEEGPDFLGAALRVGGARRRLAGDVEVHVHPMDWKHHAHANDPRYQRVRVHFTYHPGPIPAALFPAGVVHVSCRQALAANPFFSFENIDLTLYPYGARGEPPPCRQALAAWAPERCAAMLEAAGRERLRRKAARLQPLIRERGAEQVLYEEVLTALGYKHNKAACRALAAQVSLERLRAEAQGQSEVAYALLLGVAGLMPAALPAAAVDAESQAWMRALWDIWWRRREAWAHRVLPASLWHLGGVRPANHPARRLMAAALLFAPPARLAAWRAAAARDPWAEDDALLWATPPETYWHWHLTWGGDKLARPLALVGPERATAIRLNVLFPYLVAEQGERLLADGRLSRLPMEAQNRLARQTALNLFGADHPGSLYHDGVRQQGLMQIFVDYCLNDRSRCRACRFRDLLE